MRLDKNILKSFLLLALWAILTNCASSGGVVSVDPCVEIPFQDGAEGACTNTVSHKAYLVKNKEWESRRPHMIMLHVSDWTKIKLEWLKGCRLLIKDGKKCNVAVDSVDNAIQRLDGLVKGIVGKVQ